MAWMRGLSLLTILAFRFVFAGETAAPAFEFAITHDRGRAGFRDVER
jgi:hypothetical protein